MADHGFAGVEQGAAETKELGLEVARAGGLFGFAAALAFPEGWHSVGRPVLWPLADSVSVFE
ncbi:hypothetical protein HMPREF2748_03510 [Corynebacterium sp. HMSC077B05]|nr:hypothetical protein HMPREF2748_03510 [Corynebacterium sp. HMSC077B05]